MLSIELTRAGWQAAVMSTASRRTFLSLVPTLVVPAVLHRQAPATGTTVTAFPSQHPDVVREMVTVSHFNIARVKELATRQPALTRAAWDWGYGDWEDALGAASHVGNREIAEYLL